MPTSSSAGFLVVSGLRYRGRKSLLIFAAVPLAGIKGSASDSVTAALSIGGSIRFVVRAETCAPVFGVGVGTVRGNSGALVDFDGAICAV